MLFAEVSRFGFFENVATSPEHLGLLRRLNPCSLIIVPLIARGRTLAALTLAYSDSARRYSKADLDLAVELGNRAALALDNARLYQAAQAAIQLRDEFLSIASHELKTPLTPLKLQLQTLMRMSSSSMPTSSDVLKRLPKALDTCDRQVTRINKLVDELLDVSRIHSGKFSLELEHIDLAEVVREVAGRFVEDLARVGCEVRLDLPKALVGHWDRLRLEQIVTNLVSNAIRYAPGAPLHLSLCVEDSKAVLRVKDHGPGIEKGDQDRIFKRFERAAPISTVGGLGLGLYIVSQILAAHGGSIELQSKPGMGATFVVRLPLDALDSKTGLGDKLRERTSASAATSSLHDAI
jgi:signal transduction histidine kinase